METEVKDIVSAFDDAHKMANNLVRNAEPLKVPFVNYAEADDCLVLAIIPGPCPDGYEDKLRALIDRNVGFKCTVRPGDNAIIVATFLIGDRDPANGRAHNSCEFVIPNDDSELKAGFERLIDETTANIKIQ